MSWGAYISQDLVRKAAPPGGGHGDPDSGYEILHTNIHDALDELKLTHDIWDWNSAVSATFMYLVCVHMYVYVYIYIHRYMYACMYIFICP